MWSKKCHPIISRITRPKINRFWYTHFWYTESWKNLTQVLLHLFSTPDKCHCTTLWNAELVHLIKMISFPQKKWMALKTASYYVEKQLEFQSSNITRYGNPLDLSHDCWPAISWARCIGALSVWKICTSPEMLPITGSSSCVSNSSW